MLMAMLELILKAALPGSFERNRIYFELGGTMSKIKTFETVKSLLENSSYDIIKKIENLAPVLEFRASSTTRIGYGILFILCSFENPEESFRRSSL